MKHNQIYLKDLKTVGDCYDAVDSIESDYSNYQGGLTRWLSGYETILTAGAKAKIKAIRAKISKFPCEDEYEE